MLNCYDATRLMSERLDRPLGRLEKLNLRLHLFICKSCGHFDDHMQHLRLLTRNYAKGQGAAAAPPPDESESNVP